jgi:pimeloyl-ACP methyl ester carboxylesterase
MPRGCNYPHREQPVEQSCQVSKFRLEVVSMKRFWLFVFLVAICLALGASSSRTVAAQTSPSQSKAIGNDSFLGIKITHTERTALSDGLAHYRYDVRVGPGQFDVIRLHRIVRERIPYWPIHTVSGIFFLAGSPNYFEAMFIPPMITQAIPRDHSIALFLAKNNVDVWGMDYAWALVPAETTDLAFMKDWGVAKDTQHVETALMLARLIRRASGQPFDRLHLAGFSYGGIVSYSVTGRETQLPPMLRSVGGLIILDVAVKLEDQDKRDIYCNSYAVDKANLDSGIYSDDTGLFLKLLSDLALNAPDDASEIIPLPGVTNFKAALFFGANTEALTGLFWHFVGGNLDENGIPDSLRFTEDRAWVDLMGNIPPHLPMQTNVDTDAAFCGEPQVTFDDHLGQITVPILFVGAAGGFGRAGFYSVDLTSSKDAKKILVQLLPDDMRAMDWGHVDNILARDAQALVWQPILDWLTSHR